MSTSRLKRKLDEQGVNYSSGRATENFCLVGTPLPPLEKSKDTGEFVPLWKQDVRDEQGRRRLHGAFTGGFSAGYFNSVGSKEGWTPSTFKSSRGERNKAANARPEDFMDEEDLAELRETQLMGSVKQQRDILGGTQAELAARGATEEDSIASGIERALLPPPDDSPGVRLLKKMGWRPGQGVGPRVTWRQRKIQDLLAAGKTLNNVDVDALEEDEEAKKHMYPPRDTVAPHIARKDNSYGVGYVPERGLNEALGRGAGPSGPKLASGFGLGALNEADDDDLDVYDASSHKDRTYMPYDSVRDAEEDGRTGRGVGKAAATASFVRQTFKDGTPLADGFVLAATTANNDAWWPMPKAPDGWKPDPRRVWQKYSTDKENGDNEPAKIAQPSWRSKLTASERGSILGETALPREQRSVFDYLSKADRDRIQQAASSLHAPAAPPTPAPAPAPEPTFSIPYTAPHIASAALRGFMPFPSDPAKQARYIAYLRSQASPDDPPPAPGALPGQSTADLHKELADFAKSAALFKPVEGAMANRFTSAAVVDTGPKIIEGLHQPVHRDHDAEEREREAARAQEAERREEVVEGSKAHAVRMGMYGALTREAVPWQPARLLCKRFGVKDPNPEIKTDAPLPGASGAAGSGGWQPEQGLADADLLAAGVAPGAPANANDAPAGGAGGPRNLENVGLGEDDEQGRDTLTYVVPSVDIFKAIFASDDEDSDAEDAAAPPDPPAKDVEMPAAGPSEAGAVPAHLRVDSDAASSTAYEPKASTSSAKATGPVDIATFKPVFVPRSERETKKAKDKKDKDKKKARAIVSFDAMDEDAGGGLVIAPKAKEKHKDKDKDKDKERKKKKRRKEDEGGAGGEEDVEMWVEKPPPEAVAAFGGTPAEPEPISESPSVASLPAVEGDSRTHRGRKRAVDFM
ncbi:hypothetical protein FA95DRAFT_1631093 [Auriscalpium vulgare]|uniref:Uncharacterized protein n=1 Tax=Auriscalpium vulgare TaxID=40419 RepID=A0ACB8S4F2_9AGAM|nr:hypothetical protein FA95DRAFT_1631093 [Auriscalpium vulgare]